ncbi:hypothetical protein A4G18_01995 [Pasteurellaceae bacterium Pebbles2]|nr:hypothetical protein [Pasteurellaceae bacterium Pebbles2]
MSTQASFAGTKIKIAIQLIIGLYIIFLGLTDRNANGLSAIGSIIAGSSFFLFAYINIRKVSSASSNLNNYNQNNDGIYHHYLEDGQKKFEIKIDDNQKTIYLADGNNAKTYSYNDIREWSYRVNTQTAIARMTGGVSAGLENLATASQLERNAWDNNGFFITVNDLQNPIWHIKFWGEGRVNRDNKFWTSVHKQCETWMLVFDKVINNK